MHERTLADELIASTDVDLDSPREWDRAHQFFRECLLDVCDSLPELVQRPELKTDSMLMANGSACIRGDRVAGVEPATCLRGYPASAATQARRPNA